MKDLFTRGVTAIFFVGTVVGSVLFGKESYFFLFLLVSLLSINEWYRLVGSTIDQSKLTKLYKPLALVSTLAIYSVSFLVAGGWAEPKWLLPVGALPFLFFAIELYSKTEKPLINIGLNFLGIVFLVVPLSLQHLLVFTEGEYQFGILLGTIFLVWLIDTGAYLAGSAMGKTPFFPSVSPKKTWEGFIGGCLTVIGFSQIISLVFKELGHLEWFGVSVIVIVFSTLGDLIESRLKRSVGVKDTGNLLPGHGGILDRFDAFYLSLPFVAAYIMLIR